MTKLLMIICFDLSNSFSRLFSFVSISCGKAKRGGPDARQLGQREVGDEVDGKTFGLSGDLELSLIFFLICEVCERYFCRNGDGFVNPPRFLKFAKTLPEMGKITLEVQRVHAGIQSRSKQNIGTRGYKGMLFGSLRALKNLQATPF